MVAISQKSRLYCVDLSELRELDCGQTVTASLIMARPVFQRDGDTFPADNTSKKSLSEYAMILNENKSWSDIGSIVTDDSPETVKTAGIQRVRDAFQQSFGDPTMEKLDAGMKIYKFNSERSVVPQKYGGDAKLSPGTPLSPWWTSWEPFKHDGGLVQKLKLAEANGVSAREWGRLTSVIREDWNSLEYILWIELLVPVYGAFGGFKGMPRIGKGKESMRKANVEKSSGSSLPGGGTQFYIPGLTYACVRTHGFLDL